MAESPRIDSHAHIWDAERLTRYKWMTEELEAIRRPFSFEDLRENLHAHGLDGVVLVQTLSAVDETEEFLALAGREAAVAGVVGWVDLTATDVARQIDRLKSLNGGDRLVGIRHQVHDEPDTNWLLRDAVIRGVKAVIDAGLVYDLLIRPRELSAALELVERMPAGRFIVDHIAKPPMSGRGELEPWREGIAALAAHGHVACKVSGMVTEADWEHWTIDDIRACAEHVMESFGPQRVFFGSDWPVATLAASYAAVVGLAEELSSILSADERQGFWGQNAVRWYRLPGYVAAPAAETSDG